MLKVHFFEWQVLWTRWHLGYDKCEDEDFGLWDHFLFIGPFQFRWVTSAIETD